MSLGASSLSALPIVRDVDAASLSHLAGDEVVPELLRALCVEMSADAATVLVLDGSGTQLVAAATAGLAAEIRPGYRMPIGIGFAGRIASSGEPALLDDVRPGTIAVQRSYLLEQGITKMAGVPLTIAGEVVGVLDVAALERDAFDADDLEHLAVVGEQIVTALAAHQQNEEIRAAQVMQRSLLPSRLPRVEGVEFAARFVPASGLGIGGDWYDAFTLPDGRLVVVVGDVVGHGLRAAIVMGRLRSVVRAYAFDSDDPADVIRRVTQKFAHFEPSEMATMLVAQLSPPMGEVVIASAGHPPPVLARPEAAPVFVELDPAPPIGVRGSRVAEATRVALPSGSTLMCYTDGLFERRDIPFDESLDRLRSSLQTGPIDRAISNVMTTMVGDELVEDDTALLALRRLPAD